MRVGLFIPCYVDQFYPNAAIATLQLLEKQAVEVIYPMGQTCCGQPLANSGFGHMTAGCEALFTEHFRDVDYIVSPSGSCVLHIKEHLHSDGNDRATAHIRTHTYELTEFLTDILGVESLPARFPHRVGLHQSCRGQRGLKISQMSELVAPAFSKPIRLLNMVSDIELISLKRPDECCGFGGIFCVTEEAISVKMGKDRIADHVSNRVEYITSADMSCLMHLEGIIKRQKTDLRVIHIAEILNAG